MDLRAVLVDDEQLARDELGFLLEQLGGVEVIGQAGNGVEALTTIDRLQPDLVFLDVQMPGLTGFEVARRMLDTHAPTHIIFVTAYDQHAIEAFEVNAVDYLLKPVDPVRLGLAVQRAQRRVSFDRSLDRGDGDGSLSGQLEKIVELVAERQNRRDRLAIKVGERFILVQAEEIVYASLSDESVTVVTNQHTGTSNYRTLDELHTRLDPGVFWRVHRSHLVNINKIKEIVPWFSRNYILKMKDDKSTEIPVSRTQTRRLREYPEVVDPFLVQPEPQAGNEGSHAGGPAEAPAQETTAAEGSEIASLDRQPPLQDLGLQLHFDTIAHDFNPPPQPTADTHPLAPGGEAPDSRPLASPSIRLAQVKEELVAWIKTLLSAAVYAVLIVTFGFQVARVEGQSMAPTLEDQDRLIVNKAVYRISEPRRGDIVMLYYPLNPDKSFVKRVIAEEGDQVRIVDGRVYVNDVPVHDDYVPPQYRSHDEWGPQVIPEGYYFVMGDHRNNSSDSRTWGFVPKKYIIGKVQLRWWPVPTARVF